MPAIPFDAMLHAIQNAANAGAFGFGKQTRPTEAQLLAGNYAKGRVMWQGLPLVIEQPRGTYREGKGWRTLMASHYGYIAGTRGNDGDEVDCFIGSFVDSSRVYVVNQVLRGRFDEHKVMLCYDSEEAARDAYMRSYSRGWTGLDSIAALSLSQFKWWLKNGDLTKPLSADNLPYEGTEPMNRVYWTTDAEPMGQSLDKLMYGLRQHDGAAGLLLDSVSVADIHGDPDNEAVLTMDAMVTPFNKLQPKMNVLQAVMARSGGEVKPVAVQVSEPFKQRGTVNVATVFELSDGQTVTVYFHNPDSTPAKLAPGDELISWKWLLNKKDVTIVVAPERGSDLNIREVARRLMRLAEKNSPAFQRANAKRSERMAAIQSLTDEVAGLEATLASEQNRLEVVKQQAQEREAKAAESVSAPVVAYVRRDGDGAKGLQGDAYTDIGDAQNALDETDRPVGSLYLIEANSDAIRFSFGARTQMLKATGMVDRERFTKLMDEVRRWANKEIGSHSADWLKVHGPEYMALYRGIELEWARKAIAQWMQGDAGMAEMKFPGDPEPDLPAQPTFAVGDYLKANFPSLNKRQSIADYKENPSGSEWLCKVQKVLSLTPEAYDEFANNLMASNPSLGEGGSASDSPLITDDLFKRSLSDWTPEQQAEWKATSYSLVTVVEAPGRETFVVDAQGYDYARYVGLDPKPAIAPVVSAAHTPDPVAVPDPDPVQAATGIVDGDDQPVTTEAAQKAAAIVAILVNRYGFTKSGETLSYAIGLNMPRSHLSMHVGVDRSTPTILEIEGEFTAAEYSTSDTPEQIAAALDMADFAELYGDYDAQGNLSPTITNEESIFFGKPLPYALAAMRVEEGASKVGASVHYGDFNGSTSGGLSLDGAPTGTNTVIGITAQIHSAGQVWARADISEDGDVVLLKGAAGSEEVAKPDTAQQVADALSALIDAWGKAQAAAVAERAKTRRNPAKTKKEPAQVVKQEQPENVRLVVKRDPVSDSVEWQAMSGDNWVLQTTFDTLEAAKEALKSRGYDIDTVPVLEAEWIPSAKRFGPAKPIATAATTENPDAAILRAIIDGTTDPLTADLEALEAIYERNAANAEIQALFEQAVNVVIEAENKATASV